MTDTGRTDQNVAQATNEKERPTYRSLKTCGPVSVHHLTHFSVKIRQFRPKHTFFIFWSRNKVASLRKKRIETKKQGTTQQHNKLLTRISVPKQTSNKTKRL
jgi:hypothetical protein